MKRWKILICVLTAALMADAAIANAAVDSANRIVLPGKNDGIKIADINGVAMAVTDNMALSSGLRVATEENCDVRFDLQDNASISMDRFSAVQFFGGNDSSRVLLETGKLFLYIPGNNGAVVHICTPAATVTARGYGAGYVETVDGLRSKLHVLSGLMRITGYDPVSGELESSEVRAGQTAVCEIFPESDIQDERVVITVQNFLKEDVPSFVAAEVAANKELQDQIDREEAGITTDDLVENLEQRAEAERMEAGLRQEQVQLAAAEWVEEDAVTVSDAMFLMPTTPTLAAGAVSAQTSPQNPTADPKEESGNDNLTEDADEEESSGPDDVKPTPDNVGLPELIVEKEETITGGEYSSVQITAGVGNGTVYLNGVHIYGNLTVNGGGSASVYVSDCTVDGEITVDKKEGDPVHLVLEGSTTASVLTVLKDNSGISQIDIKDNASVSTVTAQVSVDITAVNIPEVTLLANSEGDSAPLVVLNGDIVGLDTFELDLPQKHQYTVKQTVARTCASSGYTVYTCIGCVECVKDGKRSSYIGNITAPDKEGHVFVEKEVVPDKVDQSGSECGYTLQECKICHIKRRIYNE